MRIGEVAARTGVAARMLRYYEQQGLLQPQRRGNGYRDYSAGDVQQVATIRDLSSSGVPIRFIKIVLERRAGTTVWTSACEGILADMVHTQIAELDSKIEQLTMSREALKEFARHSAG